MSITFDGDLDVVDVQIELFKNIVKKRGFDNCTVKVEPVGSAGENFASNVKRFTVRDGDKTFNMIVKIAPTISVLREAMNCHHMFRHETMIYTEVLPRVLELQKSAGVPKEEQLRFPECYGAISQTPYEAIVLEDLKVSGMEMRNKFVSLNNEEVKSVLRLLAAFHALTVVLRIREPETYDDIKARIVELFDFNVENVKFNVFMTILVENSSALLRYDQKDKVKIDIDMFKSPSVVKMADMDAAYVGICHGDCWSNNMLFKQEDDGSIQSALIDYQILNLRSPAADVQYFIFASTDREIRSKHYKEWLDYYHEKFIQQLAYFDIEPSLYPKEKYEEDLQRWAKPNYALLLTFFNMVIRESGDALAFQNMSEEEIVDMMNVTAPSSDSALSLKNLKGSADKLEKRIQELTDCFLDNGYF